MIVAIDGPAGAGKSTLSRRLAERLGFRFLDTGAMYRAVALAAMRRQVDPSDAEAIGRVAAETTITFSEERVFLNGEDVTEEIRTPAVTTAIRYAADNPDVRRRLVEEQRHIGEGGNLVTEGRDQGTVAFPDAACKIFLTASPEERARRRVEDLRNRGQSASFEEILAEQTERDRRDQTRPVGRLIKAEDAVELCTDGMTPEEVVSRMEQIVQAAQEKQQAKR
ncbi:MAG: (d)CMP kinase [Planctomycetes bacterium]|nr:(d)CMP kinase [Planctomycetota bacterium]